MRIGASAFNWTRNFELKHLDLFPLLREHGLKAFEVPLFELRSLPTERLRKAGEAYQIEITVCAILPGTINPISADVAERRKARSYLEQCIETTADLGGSLIGGPLYAPIGYLPGRRRTAEEWNRSVECLQALGGKLEEYGIDMAIEPVNRSETFFLTTAGETADLCRAVDHHRIGVLLDTFHANIEEKDVGEAILSLGSLLKHVHASENDRGIAGTGSVNFTRIVKALREIGYGGYMMIEGLGYLPPEENVPFMWRRTAETGDAIVIEGAKYLGRLL